jgi:crotonobetainyl-CoA:carnitine CoA-transferase CaiB-like acyl-CoA transferase
MTLDPHAAAARPLANIKVIDAASFMAAPMAAMWLADFGAEVIKIEHPNGDMMRTWGSSKAGVPLFWKVVGRNKKSVTLDFHHRKGQELLKQMVAKADVLVENFRPGTMARWGLDYEALSKVNPRLVMLSISAFGQTGPYSPRAGFGTLAEAMSGYAHVTGEASGPPTLPGFGLADSVTGVCGAFATMVALHERDTVSGRGQSIDLAIYEPMLTMLGHQFIEYDQLGIIAGRLGSRLPFAAPRNAFKTQDGRWLAMSCSAQSVFERACHAIARPDLITDPRFRDNAARTENYETIDSVFAEWIGARPAETVLEVLNNAGAAAAPIYDARDIFEDPHFQARESITSVPDEELETIRMQNVVPKLSRTPGHIDHAGPRLGEHTADVYREWLGLGASDLDQLYREGVI